MFSPMLFLTLLLVSSTFADNEVMKVNANSVKSVLEALPRECHKNGKTFKAGEEFEFGNLRYKCQDYGVYTIDGCQTAEKKHLAIGEKLIENNTLHQCLGNDGSVFYRETTCGILGMPDCDKIPPPKGFAEAVKKSSEHAKHAPAEGENILSGVKLPEGWTVINKESKKIDGTNATLLTQVLMFKPNLHNDRAKRQSGRGIGQVLGVERLTEGEPGHPLDPAMVSPFKGGKSSPHESGSHSMPIKANSDKSKLIGTQDVRASMGVIKSGDKNDHDLVDLNARSPTKVAEGKFKPGTTSGSRSSVEWKDRKITVNGKSVAMGPGTFSFGNRPTQGGAFVMKDD